MREGVKPLLLSADFKRADGSPTATPPRHVLAVDVVRHVGEAVAAVVASCLARAVAASRTPASGTSTSAMPIATASSPGTRRPV